MPIYRNTPRYAALKRLELELAEALIQAATLASEDMDLALSTIRLHEQVRGRVESQAIELQQETERKTESLEERKEREELEERIGRTYQPPDGPGGPL